jgi:hypothetical protein
VVRSGRVLVGSTILHPDAGAGIADGPALAYIRPHHLAVVAAAGQGALHGTVRHSFTRGGTVHIEVDCPEVGSALEVELPAGAPELALVEVGRPIGLAPRSVNVHAAKISSLAA